MHVRRSLSLLLATTALACLCIGLRIPLAAPFPNYAADTATWASSGHIVDTFTPLAYPLFLGPAYRLAGDHGIIVLQIALQIAIATLCFLILRRLGLSSRWSAIGSLPVALHPDLLVSVVKIWDVPLSTFLLLLLVYLCLRLHQQSTDRLSWVTVALSFALAAGLFCRPNYILLLPVIFFSFYGRRSSQSLRFIIGNFVASLVIACAVFALLGVAGHGKPFIPQNGPYNLYAGNNPHTLDALLTHLNAESSLTTSYLELHPDATDADLHSISLKHFYTHHAMRFALGHPGAELELVAVKFFTLFRPDTKVHRLVSVPGIMKGVLALPAVLVAVMLLLPGRPPLQFDDWFLLSIELAYILPFLITNSDPRFRIPLDAVLLLHFVFLLHRRLHPVDDPAV